jgi:hypothetical protein
MNTNTDNPETPPPLPIDIIYSYDHQTNIPWSIPEYKVPR